MRGLFSATGTVGTTTVIAAPLFALRDGNSAISGADRVNSVGGGVGPLRPRQPASGSASTAAIRAGVSLLVIAGLIIRKFRDAEQNAVRVTVRAVCNGIQRCGGCAQFHHPFASLRQRMLG